MTAHFYNTTGLNGDDLHNVINKAKTQKEKVLIFFNAQKGQLMTAWNVKDSIFNDKTPITSVRRAISDLADENKLVKTDVTEEAGPFMAKCYKYVAV